MRTEGTRATGARMSDGAGDPRLRWYPPSWRVRYGDEFVALLQDHYGDRLPALTRLGLFTGGLRERARQSGLSGDSVPERDRLRAGALVVLVAWTSFVVAGASFAKLSEHFDEALPHGIGTHRVADLAFGVLQAVAGVAGIFVIAGALLAAPAFVRFVRAGGWSPLRGHFLRALAATGITVVVTVPLLVSAHHLTSHQRNGGGLHWYGALYLIWVALIVVTLTLWTVLAVAAARRVQFSTLILAAEALLAGAVAVAMVIMVGATAVWWGAMANYAPAFLSGGPAGTSGSPWDLWLVATVVVMALAMGIAAVGVVREVRVWSKMRAVE